MRLPVPRIASGLKPLLLLVGVAAAIAVGVGVMLWAIGPTYSLLYANLAPKKPRRSPRRSTARAFPTSSKAAATPSACRPSSSPRRASSSPAQGLPESGGGVNAMTKDPGFGVSQFMENARYQHALETELARTIASLQNVQGARVHLADGAPVRVRQRPPARFGASVFLQIEGRPPAR